MAGREGARAAGHGGDRTIGRHARPKRREFLAGLALDTGLHNDAARALYTAYGFDEQDIRRAPDDRSARAIGGPGFVGYFKAA